MPEGPSAICWCGHRYKGQREWAYRCVPFSLIKDQPWLKRALLSHGCDPDRGTSEVGVSTLEDIRAARERWEAENDRAISRPVDAPS